MTTTQATVRTGAPIFARGVIDREHVLMQEARVVKPDPQVQKTVDDLLGGNSGGVYAWDMSPKALQGLLDEGRLEKFLYRLLAGGEMISYFPQEDVDVKEVALNKVFTPLRNLFIEEEFIDEDFGDEAGKKALKEIEEKTRSLLPALLGGKNTRAFTVSAGDTGVGWYEGVVAVNVDRGEVRLVSYINPP